MPKVRQQIFGQGCQIFLATKYQNGKYITNNQKINHLAIKYTKWQ
jgi:hypothetical protein